MIAFLQEALSQVEAQHHDPIAHALSLFPLAEAQ
jgi:hypothetical protein